MAIVHGQSRRAHVSDPRVQRLVRGAVAWSVLAAVAIVVLSLLSAGTSTWLADVEGLPLEGLSWVLLAVPTILTAVSWRWGQDSRIALVVPALVLDLGVVALGPSPAVLFAPAALAVTVAALARRD